MFLSFCGKVPRNEGAAFVAPNATVQGDVILKAGSTVWYGAVLRGDDGQLIIGENSNVQDNAVLHLSLIHISRIIKYFQIVESYHFIKFLNQ